MVLSCYRKILKEKSLDNISDYIPNEILKTYNLPTLKTALIWIHKPKNKKMQKWREKDSLLKKCFASSSNVNMINLSTEKINLLQ